MPAGTINALVRDNLSEGNSTDEQLEFMQDKCAQAAVHRAKCAQYKERQHDSQTAANA
ncbi:TPA: hypothetical protein ACH3X1_015063 [Trebouxia sp. C0004]